MYRLLKKIGDNTGKSLGNGTDDDANEEAAANDGAEVAVEGDNKRPCNWFFNGWLSFLLYGPMDPPGMRIDLFIECAVQEDGAAKKNNGRNALRKRDSDKKSAERTRGGGDRDISVRD